jgi:hypothetical protein
MQIKTEPEHRTSSLDQRINEVTPLLESGGSITTNNVDIFKAWAVSLPGVWVEGVCLKLLDHQNLIQI